MLDHKVYFYLLKKEFYPKDRTLDPKFVTTPFPLKTSKSTIHDVILAKSQYLTIDRKSLEYKEILNIDNYDRIVLVRPDSHDSISPLPLCGPFSAFDHPAWRIGPPLRPAVSCLRRTERP